MYARLGHPWEFSFQPVADLKPRARETAVVVGSRHESSQSDPEGGGGQN